MTEAIHYKEPQPILFSSFPFVSSSLYCIQHQNIYPLSQKRENPIHILNDLYQQQQRLLKHGYSFYSLAIQDIHCINGTFLCTEPNWIRPLRNQAILFDTPFIKNQFCCPAIQSIYKLPSTPVTGSTAFEYSLASLASFLFWGIPLDSITAIQMESIRHTKWYWFFQRMREREPTFLLI